MLVLKRLQGKMTQKGVTFESRTWMLYKGKVATANTGGGGGAQQQVVPTGPWGPQVPYLQQLFQQAGQLYNQGPPQYYPGQTVLPAPELVGQTTNAAVNQVNQNIPQNNAAAGQAAGAVQNAYNNPVAQTAQNLTPNFEQSIMALLGGAPSSGLNQAGQAVLPTITGAIQAAGSGSAPQYQAPGAAAGNIDINPALQANLNGTGMSPYLDQIVQGALRSSTNEFNRNVLPGIGDAASAAGQVGGTRQGVAQGIAAGDLANSQTDMVGRIYQQAFDQAASDRNNTLGIVAGLQGQNAQTTLQTNALNEQIRAALTGEKLGAAGLGANILGQGAQLGQQGQQAGSSLIAQLLAQGQNAGTDQLVRAGGLLPLLQGANLQGLDFANQLGVQGYGFQQAQQDADVEKWFFNQFAPYNALTQFQNFVTGPYGSSVDGTKKPNSGNQSALFGNGSFTNLDNDPVTGLPSPWKWF